MEETVMRIRNFFFAVSAIVLAASCVKENTPESSEKNLVNYVPMEFSTAVETKTELTAEGKVNWLAEDQISIIDNSAAAETHNNKFTVVAGGSSSATFTGTVPEDADEFYALYPYKSNAAITEGSLSASLPANQNAKPGSFADDLAFMIAKADADNKLTFKNVCSHIKFTLAEGITNAKSITLMGNKAEILAGNFSVAWNNGDPAVTVEANRNAETYVTLRNEDGSVLAPGEYYFTVLPVTFAEGFTVIVSREDGSQIAKSTTQANDKVSTRNKVLVMKPLKASDYTSHLNYFVKYNDGFDLTFGGVTINKADYGDAVLVSDNRTNSGNLSANNTGVYFITSSCSSAKFNNGSALYKSVAIIGADASQRSAFDFQRQAKPTDDATLLLMANLRCTVGDKNAFAQGNFDTFENMAFSNCHFKNVGKNFIEFKTNLLTKLDLFVEDCEFGISGATVYILNTGSQESKAQNITFKNNIFYAESGTSAFKIIHGDKLTIDTFNLESNTLDHVVSDGKYIRIGDINTSFSMTKNLYYEVGASSSAEFRAANAVNSATGTTTNNVYYNADGTAAGHGIGSTAYPNLGINSLKKLTQNPMPETWNPAEEVYGAYTFEDGISNTIGAKRSGKAATADAASYRFPSVDLGTF